LSLFKKIKNRFSNYEFKLFCEHFVITNVLYSLQFYFYSKFGFYLYFSPLKIMLVKIPDNNQCFHFIYEKNDFCKLNVDSNSFGNCLFHFKKKSNLPLKNNLREYYFNFSNIYKVSEKTLSNIIETYSLFSYNYEKFKELIDFFNLDYNSTINDLKEKFRKKIKENMSSNEKRILIENYKTLKNLFIE